MLFKISGVLPKLGGICGEGALSVRYRGIAVYIWLVDEKKWRSQMKGVTF